MAAASKAAALKSRTAPALAVRFHAVCCNARSGLPGCSGLTRRIAFVMIRKENIRGPLRRPAILSIRATRVAPRSAAMRKVADVEWFAPAYGTMVRLTTEMTVEGLKWPRTNRFTGPFTFR